MPKTPYMYFRGISPLYRTLRRALRTLRYSGTRVFCPCCEKTFSGWLDGSDIGRCPNCDAATRDKVLVHCLGQLTDTLPRPCRTLYFAPDRGPLTWLHRRAVFDVTTADLSAPGVDENIDITDIPKTEKSQDLVICSHVLEHVPDDRKAMSELRRILTDTGVLLVQVPFARDRAETDEDPSIVDPQERIRRFGQFDHVRHYGRDLLDRLADSGFAVRSETVEDLFTEKDQRRLGLWNDIIFICTPATP